MNILQYSEQMESLSVLPAPRPTPTPAADITLSSLIALLALSGLITNSISCLFFLSTRNSARSANSRYFKLLYTAISSVDTLICLLQIPVVHCLYTKRRSSAYIFNSTVFNYTWTALWRGATTTSVFLVAQLSASRLALLMSSQTRLHVSLIWLPAVSFTVIVLLVMVPALTQNVEVDFLPGSNAIPGMYGTTQGVDLIQLFMSGDPVPAVMIRNENLNNIVWSCLSGVPLLPISLLCAASVWYLRRAAQRAKSKKMQHHQHTHATITIVCVTVLYIVCNVPSLGFLVNRLYRTDQLEESLSLREVADTLNPSYFEKLYFRMLLICCSVVNSSLNPLLYLWRMSSFRNFIRRSLRLTGSEVSVNCNSNSYSVRSDYGKELAGRGLSGHIVVLSNKNTEGVEKIVSDESSVSKV